MKLRVQAMILALVCLWHPLSAWGEAPSVRDNTTQLQEQTIAQINTLSSALQEETDYRLVIELRHFLGGAEVEPFAGELLRKEPDSENTILLLAVVGEETYALVAGERAQRILSKEARNSLLSVYFREAFLKREYDEALLVFSAQLARQLAAASGVTLGPGALPLPVATPTLKPNGPYVTIKLPDLDSVLREPIEDKDDPRDQFESRDRRDRGMSIGSIVVIGFVLSAIFGKGKRKGCGCGPLGWIFGVFGLSKLFGWRR